MHQPDHDRDRRADHHAVVVVVLAVFVWQQRTSIEHHIAHHNCNFSFFGMHLSPPDHLKRVCD